MPIINFMDKFQYIANEYSGEFPLWLIILISICSTLVGNTVLLIQKNINKINTATAKQLKFFNLQVIGRNKQFFKSKNLQGK